MLTFVWSIEYILRLWSCVEERSIVWLGIWGLKLNLEISFKGLKGFRAYGLGVSCS